VSETNIPVKHVVSAMLYNSAGELFLQQRDNAPGLRYPFHWTPFGGQVEAGEDPRDAIYRELEEELELTGVNLKWWQTLECPVRTIPGEVQCIHHSYMGLLDRDPSTLVLHEGQDMRFYRPDEIPALDVAFGQKPLLVAFCAMHILRAF
jgi:8-oxo-dGTP diphosphatase